MAKIRILKQDIKQSPKIIFTSKALKQLGVFMSSIHAKTKEFLFLGYVDRKGKNFTIEEFFLVPQEKCSGAYCETDDSEYPDWIAKNVPISKRKTLRIHGHSHVNMITNPSGTDDTQLLRLINEVDDYFIQLIINHNMNYKVNLWLKEENIVIEDPDLFVQINNLILPIQNFTNFKISDGKYELKNNIIVFKEGLKLNLLTNKLYLEDENIEYIVKKPTIKETILPKISTEDTVKINKEMDSLIKPQYYNTYFQNTYNKKNLNVNDQLSLDDEDDIYYGSEYGNIYGLK